MKAKETQAIIAIWAASLTLIFFWILNILKEANSGVKNFLNFYPPVGPLLGLFIFSILSLFAFLIILQALKPTNQKTAFWALVSSSILFFLMVFPSVFEVIAEIISGI